MILIDSSIDVYGVLFSNLDTFDITKNQNAEEEYNFFVHLFLTQLLKRMQYFNASTTNRVVIALDDKSWRKDFFESVKEKYFEGYYKTKKVTDEGYKGHRKKSSNINWEKVYSMMNDIHESLNKYSDIISLKIKNAEADDIIGSLSLHYPEEYTTIISRDKDFKQLLTRPNIKLYDGFTGRYIEVEDPKMFLKKHIIMGDKADEIPAIKEGVGEKRAINMLSSIDMLLETDQQMKYRYMINQSLIDLSLIPEHIDGDICYHYQKAIDTFNFDANGMIDFLQKYKCKELLKKINQFKLFPTENTNYVKQKTQSYNEQVVGSFLDIL